MIGHYLIGDGFNWGYLTVGASAAALALLGVGGALLRGRRRQAKPPARVTGERKAAATPTAGNQDRQQRSRHA